MTTAGATTSYDPANNLNQYTKVGGVSVTHGTLGNLSTYNGWTYSYDSQRRLISADKTGVTSDFFYDGLNRQVARVINGESTYSLWDGWTLAAEYGPGPILRNRYIYAGSDLIRSPNPSGIYYYPDAQGSTVELASDSGVLLEKYTYDLYGKPTVYTASGTVLPNGSAYEVEHLFTGQQWYKELALYDLRNRAYHPGLGRFLQPDPIGFAGDPANLYRYCGNNPVNWSDPFGLDPHKQQDGSSGGDVTDGDGNGVPVITIAPQTGLAYGQRVSDAGSPPESFRGFAGVNFSTGGAPSGGGSRGNGARLVLGGNALDPIGSPSQLTNEPLRNNRGPAAGITTPELVANHDGTVNLNVNLKVRANVVSRDPNLLPLEWQHVDRWKQWMDRMNRPTSDVSNRFRNSLWDLHTANQIREFLAPYFRNEVIQQNLDYHQPGGPHDKDYGLGP